MAKGKPWSPIYTDPGGEVRAEFIQFNRENCYGCGGAQVVIQTREFEAAGFVECTSFESCPPKRFKKRVYSGEQLLTLRAYDDWCVDDPECDCTCLNSCFHPTPCSFNGSTKRTYSGENGYTPTTCGGLALTFDTTAIDTVITSWDGVKDVDGCLVYEVTSDSTFTPAPTFNFGGIDSVCQSNTTRGFTPNAACVVDEDDFAGNAASTLTDEDNFASVAARAAGQATEGAETAECWTVAAPSSSPCPSCGGWPSCSAVVGRSSGAGILVRVARYWIVLPSRFAKDSATQYQVKWKEVTRKNRASAWLSAGEAGATAEITTRETNELFTLMTAPHDFKGSMASGDASWNQFSFDSYVFPPGDPATSKIESVIGQKSIARRAKYKFAVIGLASGNAAWDVEYLDESEVVVSTVAKSVAIVSGETALQDLDPNEVEGASAARIVNIVVVDEDETALSLGPGIAGSWMLQIIIRTGRWGWAELDSPSTPPAFYLKKKTINERIEDGGGGPCTGCPDMAYYVTAIRDKEEELSGGVFVTTILQDEISDGTNTTRWGLGGILSSSGFSSSVGAGSLTTKTKIVDELIFTKANSRICGALSLDVADSDGEVLHVEEKEATTETSNTPRACEEPQLTVADEAARLALNTCSSPPAIGSMVKQTSDDTLWEIISHPDPCGDLVAVHWVQRYGKRVPREFLTTMHPNSAVWITGIEAFACILPDEEDTALAFGVKTNNLGTSNDDQFTLPLTTGTYEYNVDWGDGTNDDYTVSTNQTHTYATAGTYDIRITGTFPRIFFNNGGDRRKLLEVKNWGNIGFGPDQSNAFDGCEYLTAIGSDVGWSDALTTAFNMFIECPLTSLPAGMTLPALTDGQSMFQQCSLTSLPTGMELPLLTDGGFMFESNSLTSLPTGMTLPALTSGTRMFELNSLTSLPTGMTLPALTNGTRMFQLNSLTSLPAGMELPLLTNGTQMFFNNSLTSLPAGMELPALTNGSSMFRDNSLTSLPTGMTLPALTNGTNMFNGNTLATARYSALLVALESGNVNNNVTFHGGSSLYNAAGGTARAALVARGWTITDGGAE